VQAEGGQEIHFGRSGVTGGNWGERGTESRVEFERKWRVGGGGNGTG